MKAKDLIYISLQIVIIGCIVFLDFSILSLEPQMYSVFIGGLLLGGGILISLYSVLCLRKSLSPFPTPRKDNKLVTKGPFRYIRHPIYTGLLVSALGVSIMYLSVFKLICTVLLFLVLYLKSGYEEKLLKEMHGMKYKNYMNMTNRFFPYL